MERLITVSDIRERYGCSGETARRYIRQMPHMERPLTVRQADFNEWEQNRERMPGNMVPAHRTTARVIVPRKRG